jgi:hypothetical protein
MGHISFRGIITERERSEAFTLVQNQLADAGVKGTVTQLQYQPHNVF